MDSFDVKILNIIQQDNRLSTEKIADQVGLSLQPCNAGSSDCVKIESSKPR